MNDDPLDRLAARWEGIRDAARLTAHQALADLEAARLRAAQRLEALQADYAAARARAEAAASQRLDELRAEIEKTRRELSRHARRASSRPPRTSASPRPLTAGGARVSSRARATEPFATYSAHVAARAATTARALAGDGLRPAR